MSQHNFQARPLLSLPLLIALACSQRGAAPGDGRAVAVVLRGEAASSPPALTREALQDISPVPASTEPPVSELSAGEPAAAEPAGARSPLRFVRFHPPGAWRLANPAELENVVLWVDQILIRHDSSRNEVSFNLGYWSSVAPPPGRSREQALVIAQQVAVEAAKHPSAFAELARRYSEDLQSRDEGGALGGIGAVQLSGWPRVLDALAETRPGQTSNVVETAYGFHIFRRREPPPEQTLSGAHIIIGHDRAEWLHFQARGALPQRSREEALALATDVYRQARAQPERFKELVERYSEHRDALFGGDFGTWSTREPNPFPPRLRRLEQLAMGEVGAVIETHLGFEVILRTEAPARIEFAAELLRLPFDPGAASGADESRERVRVRAEALAQAYAAQPERFGAPGELPTMTTQWQGGRGVSAVELQLEQLQFGSVAPTPVQAEFSFQITKRLTPQPTAVVRYSTELPAPAHPDVPFHLAGLPRERQRGLLRECGRLAAPHLGLSRARSAQFRDLQESVVLEEPNDLARATAAMQHALNEIETLLGPRLYQRYLAVLQRELASVLLTVSDDSPTELGI